MPEMDNEMTWSKSEVKKHFNLMFRTKKLDMRPTLPLSLDLIESALTADMNMHSRKDKRLKCVECQTFLGFINNRER